MKLKVFFQKNKDFQFKIFHFLLLLEKPTILNHLQDFQIPSSISVKKFQGSIIENIQLLKINNIIQMNTDKSKITVKINLSQLLNTMMIV